MPVYLEDLANSVPLSSVLAAVFMIISMRDKWHWFLLLPASLCVVGVFLLYNPALYMPRVDYQRKQTLVKGIIIILTTLIVMLSVLLEPETTTKTQLILRGIALLIVSLLPIYTCFSSAGTSTYTKLLVMMVSVFSMILATMYIVSSSNNVRTAIYTSFTGITTIFLVYYMMATSASLFSIRKQQTYGFGGMTFRQIRTPGGLKTWGGTRKK